MKDVQDDKKRPSIIRNTTRILIKTGILIIVELTNCLVYLWYITDEKMAEVRPSFN